MNDESKFRVIDGGRKDWPTSVLSTVRSPPHSAEAEAQLLATCLIDGRCVMAKCVAAGLKSAAFYERPNQIIFERLLDMHARGVEIDLATLAEELRTAKQLDEVGSYNYLMQVSNQVPTTAQMEYFLERVKYLWEMRRGITLASQFIEDTFTSTDGREGLRERAGELGQRLITFGQKQELLPLTERIEVIRERVKLAAEGQEDRSRWIYTGLETLDATLGPLGSGDEDHYIGLAGGSRSGKSALMRQIGHNVTKQGKRVLVYSRETTVNGWIKKAAAQHCRVDLNNLKDTPRADLQRFYDECEWMKKVADKQLFVVQNDASTPLVYVEDLLANYRAFENLHGRPDAVLVDYLQILLTKKRCQNREQEVTNVTRPLQGQCRQSGNVWLVGSQMNEAGLKEQRTLKREPPGQDGKPGNVIHRLPHESDLRESQSFFHDCDRLYCIYRPPVDSWGRDNLGGGNLRPEQWLCLIKRREGPEGVVKCWFEKRFTKFTEFTDDELSGGEQTQDGWEP